MTLLTLRIGLDEIAPNIWRRVMVPDDLTPRAHLLVIQHVVGWEN